MFRAGAILVWVEHQVSGVLHVVLAGLEGDVYDMKL